MRFNIKPLLPSFVIVSASIFISAFLITHATAPALAGQLSRTDIVFPVTELGNCKSESACRTYCEQRDNAGVIKSCLTFAKKYNLLPVDVIAQGEKFADMAAGGGPGGCKNEKDCVAYCENIAHIQECIAFADKYNLLSASDLAEAKNIAAALKIGAQLPGGCTGKANCVAYCQISTHIDECLLFAEKANLIPQDQLAEAKKVAQFIKAGKMPGGCTSKATCESYCAADGHSEECLNLASALGLVTPEVVDLLRKTNFQTPGNCKSEQACEAFCLDPQNQQACFAFAVKAGFVTGEEVAQLGSAGEFQACLPFADKDMVTCFQKSLGQDIFDQMKIGKFSFNLKNGRELLGRVRESRQCIQNYSSQTTHTFQDNPKILECLQTQFGNDIAGKLQSGNLACGEIGKLQDKIAECAKSSYKDKVNICIAKPCNEVNACLDGLKSPGGGQGQESDSDVQARIEACSQESINNCLGMSCPGALDCLNNLGKQSGEQKQNTNPAVKAKVQECMAVMKKGNRNQSSGLGQQQQQPPRNQEQPQSSPGATENPYPNGAPSNAGGNPQIDCSSFASVPQCSYVGATDSDNYKYCKQCFPNK